MTPDLHATVDTRLRTVGQRYTQKRRSLVTALELARTPMSIGDLLDAGTGQPQSSIYRNLSVLERAGVARRVVTEGEYARFELTEELTEHHHHLICSNCGRVEDVRVPDDVETTIDRTLDRVARKTGFAKVSHRLDLIGICRNCI